MNDRVEDYLAQQVATRPDALAFEDNTGVRVTYAQLDASADEIGARLIELGVVAGDRVLMLAENCVAAVALLFGAWKIGATVVPFNARQTAGEVQKIIDHAEPSALVCTSGASADAAAHGVRFDAVEAVGVYGTLSFAPLEGGTSDDATDVAILLYTTGTTGTPKGVMLTHANVRFGGLTSANLRNMTPDDVIYGVLPLTHVFGMCSVMAAAVYIGAPVRLAARFDVAATYDALRDGVTLCSAVPQMHALLMAYSKKMGYARLESPSLRYVSSGAAPLDPAWKRQAEAFYGVALQNGYGMTETSAGTAATTNEIGDPDISVGPALPGVEVALDMDAPGAGDGVGEVITRGPQIMKGYYKNPEETAKVLSADGWLHTGDLGRIDEKGHLHIVGRSKELIIHGGFNVYPPEVEAALNDHPQVIQAAVIGHKVGADEKVLAFCQVADGCDVSVEDLRAFAAERLAGYKRPSQIILASSLPAAPTGKILKHKLLETFADQIG
ncbi:MULTISPECIES: class I adenylate-forming enzyme family protein [Roseobacteraceae]|uniref:Long-chain-fatty-acid--CoA ligase n=1 Tax=Pseudosulfitobacter pseudonitzschiae TaxID=1402135 RepID=A0A221JWM2_9RHOB|nr:MULTISPECIES: class I adenylate-forming enzyme family protein [Roseobacteraceae]ASM71093.1 long-chain-fatty-acid--CoA ligase [Pseudosulfitobacter pseudonitzschiae]